MSQNIIKHKALLSRLGELNTIHSAETKKVLQDITLIKKRFVMKNRKTIDKAA